MIVDCSEQKVCPLRVRKGAVVRSAAQQALATSSYADLAQVRCELREGMVLLQGRVATYYLKQMAQEIVKHAAGVELVVNRVEVRGLPEEP
jgi:osmotically-inducible protein OsmY